MQELISQVEELGIEINHTTSLVMIFGTLASTLLTLVVIPIMYYFWQVDTQNRQARKIRKLEQHGAKNA